MKELDFDPVEVCKEIQVMLKQINEQLIKRLQNGPFIDVPDLPDDELDEWIDNFIEDTNNEPNSN